MLSKFKKQFQQDGEVYLRIKVIPRMSKTFCKEIMADNTIKIDIKAIPEKGKANKELLKFLSHEFQVNIKNISIINGKTSKLKLIKISNY